MVKLNLPDFDYKLKKAEGKVWIFDGIRKKYLLLTPEEWVRQHFIHFLVNEKKYPKSLIRVEGGLNYNEMKKRSDIVVFDRNTKPWMIVECKSPALGLTPATLQQVSTYNASLKAKYISVTNGLMHYCAATDWNAGKVVLMSDFPAFEADGSSTDLEPPALAE
ncbi:MAG TPA: type I restriction enzyme HsdR N-terminal domain-containing protein [Chryseosolibacter sp.]